MEDSREHEERQSEDITERLAAHCHDEQWSGWIDYMFSKCEQGYDSGGWNALIIPSEWMERWGWQARTAYKDLPEEMKESDRDEATRILKLLGSNER